MSIIKDYKVEDRLEGKVLVVYIKPYFVELANDGDDLSKNLSLREEIYKIISKKLSQSKVIMCRIMLGGILIGTIYSNNLPVAASSYVSYEDTFIKYTVKGGDTLWKIANMYGVTIDELQAINNLTHTTIYIDQILDIPTNNYIEHQIVKGDTLYKIANQYNTTVDRIREINNINDDIIYEGKTIIVDKVESNSDVKTETYTVKPYDTLYKIATAHNISVDTLKVINDLKSDMIYVGQVLRLVEAKEGSIEIVEYKVVRGDTQWAVAVDHGIPVSELQQVNGFYENTVLSIGQIIKIPIHTVAVMETVSEKHGEYLDWWDSAQYVFPINKEVVIQDFETGKTFNIKRTIGANHADCEPLTYEDTAIAKELWNGFSWKTRPVLVCVDGRQIAASMSFMPHGIEYIAGNNFDGHFDIHFLNSTRHVDGLIDHYHQDAIKIAAGVE